MKYFKQEYKGMTFWYASTGTGVVDYLRVVDYGDGHYYAVETGAFLPENLDTCTKEDFEQTYSKAIGSFEKFIPKPF